MNQPLSNEDVQNVLQHYGKPCKFLLYEDIPKIKNINELLPRTLILYQLQEIGHFCCVFINDEGLNFFDPLGSRPDDQLNLVRPDFVHSKNQDFTYLLYLFGKTKKNIIWNDTKLQKRKTSTCGHWCTIRMLYENLYDDEFASCFRGIKDKDLTVYKLYKSFE
jgi:hypothetical protein